jgi:ABC-type nitrate/sulfonate/bicarbonate transport system ATPase subunit
MFKGVKTPILHDINLCVQHLEFVSILGASGCGKSTLLEIMAGITLPDTGSILYDSKDITGRSGILGYMPQDDLLLPWLSVMENALLPVRIHKKSLSEARAKILELAEIFGLSRFLHYHSWQLSGGLKQRSAFLRTCLTGAKLMLLDEPFANLDALTRLTFQDWLVDIKTKLGLTIVLVTHDLDEAFRLSDRIYVMEDTPGIIDLVLDRKTDQFSTEVNRQLYREQVIQRLVKKNESGV